MLKTAALFLTALAWAVPSLALPKFYCPFAYSPSFRDRVVRPLLLKSYRETGVQIAKYNLDAPDVYDWRDGTYTLKFLALSGNLQDNLIIEYDACRNHAQTMSVL
jgi:hypothetical protein